MGRGLTLARTDPNALLTLYKYRSLAGPKGRKAARDIIRHNRIFWQSPLAFNDPFDCNPVLFFGSTPASRAAFAKRAVANQLRNSPRSERRKRVRDLVRGLPRLRATEMRRGFREWMAESAVTCFSQVRDCPLMWAHYADSHNGVCFIFRELMGSEPWVAFDVAYSRERPVIDYTQDSRNIIEQGILTKSIDWDYEHECRMIEYRRPPGYRQFPSAALVGVIYGARISDKDRAYIDRLLVQRPELERHEATVDDERFRLNIRRIG